MKEFLKTLKQLPKSFVLGGIIAVFILILAWFFVLKDVISDIETITYDWRSKIAANDTFSKHDSNIVLLAADDYTSKILEKYPQLKINRWPWQRKVWGDVVNYVWKGKPKAIIFDIKFEGAEGSLPENIASDKYFADAVKNKNVVIGTALSSARSNIKVIDLLLSQIPDSYKGTQLDEYCYKAIGLKIDPLRKDFTFSPQEDYYLSLPVKNIDQRNLFDNITFYGNNTIFKDLYDNVTSLGVVNLKASENTVFREHIPLYRLTYDGGISYVPSLPLAGAIAALPENERTPVKIEKNKIIIGKREIPIDNEGKFLINWHGDVRTYETVSLSKVFLADALEKKEIKNIDKSEIISSDFFKNKIVVIGQTSAGTDIHPTSMNSVYPGPEIITTTLDNILNDSDTSSIKRRKFIQEAPFALNLALTILFCSLVAVVIGKIKSNLLKIQGLALLFILFIGLVLFAFINPSIRLSLNMTYPALFMLMTGIVTYSYQIYLGNQERKQVENLFGKFVSPQVLEKLLKDKKGISQEGQRKVMTVLFSDIRGFTTLSESTSAEKVILILNEYMTEMVEVILKYNGTLDKYIGDAIMAFYNDPVEMEDHALRAVLTAIDMKETLDRLNEKWKAEGKTTLNIGLGINTGEMIVGHMGSPRLVDYTVIGDNVNLASRLEGLNKEYGTNIIISESTYDMVKEHIETDYLDECTVKGKKNAVKIYAVKGIKTNIKESILIS